MFNVSAQASRVAEAAAVRGGVAVDEVEDMPTLRAVSALFDEVWGRNDEGTPMPSEVMRSLAHAGGCVTVARHATGALAGAAVLVRAPDHGTYSLIAAATSGAVGQGIGAALKLRQRVWALGRGLTSMSWTFDPLVSRNARFNLTKLGAEAGTYETSFYGQMHDAINIADDADRLVATWRLDSVRVISATEGTAPDVRDPDLLRAEVLATGPDGEPSTLGGPDGTTWIRVPLDIVALRQHRPAEAARWRGATRAAFTEALGPGSAATGMTRAGWYRITKETPS